MVNKPIAITPGSESFDFGGPLHYHHNEDEYSYVIKGTLGVILYDDVVTAGS